MSAPAVIFRIQSGSFGKFGGDAYKAGGDTTTTKKRKKEKEKGGGQPC